MYNKNPLKNSLEKKRTKNSFSRSSTLNTNSIIKTRDTSQIRKRKLKNYLYLNRNLQKSQQKNNLFKNSFKMINNQVNYSCNDLKIKNFQNKLNKNEFSVKIDIFGNGYNVRKKSRNSLNPIINKNQIRYQKNLVLDRSEFLSFINKTANNKFYKQNNDYSKNDFKSFKDFGKKKIKNKGNKTLADKLKKRFNELKLTFHEFSFFSCNCEIFRFNKEKCFKISKLLKIINSPTDKDIFNTYKFILEKKISKECKSQISKDIKRTFSGSKYFNKHTQAYKKLERLLKAISTYKNMGYVQGMNFISASFLWHCEEEYGYYLIINIFSKLEVEKNFTDNLSGILKHCENFWNLFKQQERVIYEDLIKKNIVPEMILPEWFITLGTNNIPLKFHIILFEQIILKGWPYFYTVLIHYFKVLYKKFQYMDFIDTITLIKNNDKNDIKWTDILGV